jgi:uncharacterized protein YggE
VKSKSKWIIGAGALAAVLMVAAYGTGNATASDSTQTNKGATISVSGHGTVQGTPDTATVTIGVETHDVSAQAAMQKNNDEAQALIDELKAKGVAAKDIQTSDLSVNPDYDNHGHITGYGVSNTVTAKFHDIANAGKIIDAAAAKVGNDIRLQGVSFSIEDPSKQLADARANAVKDALAQGKQLADAAGVGLGSIKTISTVNSDVPEPVTYNTTFAASSALHSTPIEQGQQQLSVDVSVVFNLG